MNLWRMGLLTASDVVSLLLLGAVVFFTGHWSSKTANAITSEEYLFRCVIILVMCLEVKLSVLKESWGGNSHVFWGIQAAIFLCILTMAAHLYPLKRFATTTAQNKAPKKQSRTVPPSSANPKVITQRFNRQTSEPGEVRRSIHENDAVLSISNLSDFPSSDDETLDHGEELKNRVSKQRNGGDFEAPAKALDNGEQHFPRTSGEEISRSFPSQHRQAHEALGKTLKTLALPTALKNLAGVVNGLSRGTSVTRVGQFPFQQGLVAMAENLRSTEKFQVNAAAAPVQAGKDTFECEVYKVKNPNSRHGIADKEPEGTVPFTITEAAKVPCGVWVRDGDREWRVVDRKRRTLNVRTSLEQQLTNDQSEAIQRNQEPKAPRSDEKVRSHVKSSPKPDNSSFQKDDIPGSVSIEGSHKRPYGAKSSGDRDREVMKVEKNEYAHIRFRRHHRKSKSHDLPTVRKEVSAYDKDDGSSAPEVEINEEDDQGTETEFEVVQTYSTGSGDEGVDNVDIAAGYCSVEYCGSQKGFSRWTTFFTGVLLMLIGGLCHYLITQIDWRALWYDIKSYIFQVQATAYNCWVSSKETVSASFSWFGFLSCPGTRWVVISTIILILLLILCLKVYSSDWDCRPRYTAQEITGGNICVGASSGDSSTPVISSTSGKTKEHYRVTYTIDLSEEDWQRFQKSHNEKNFRPVAPRLVHSLKI